MIDIMSLIPGKKKKTGNGWHSFNAVCCHYRGHRQDTRKRGGIRFGDEDSWSYHCFNCGFTCGFTPGKSISYKTRQLFSWLGVDEEQITKWNFKSIQQRELLDYVKLKRETIFRSFKEVELPDGEILTEDNPEHSRYVDYLRSRGIKASDYPFMITPHDEGRNANRIIIPYTFKNKIVGHISRYMDNRIPKFIKEQQTGYVFGYDFQKPGWEFCVAVEGVFDALSISGCGLTHETISDDQAEILRSLKRKIIVVPDLDKTGLDCCERALELGFHVSIPNWEKGIKDANDAVIRYGKVPTLLSIIQNSTNSLLRVNLLRRQIAKRI